MFRRNFTCCYSCGAVAASGLRSGLVVEFELFEVVFAVRRGDGGIASSFMERDSLISASDFLKILLSFFPARSFCVFSSRALFAVLCLSKVAESILAEASMGSAKPIVVSIIASIKFFILDAR